MDSYSAHSYDRFSEIMDCIIRDGLPIGYSDDEAAAIKSLAFKVDGAVFTLVQSLDSIRNREKRRTALNAANAVFDNLNFIIEHLYNLKRVRGQNLAKGRAARAKDSQCLLEAVQKVVRSKSRPPKISLKAATLIRSEVLCALNMLDGTDEKEWPTGSTIKAAMSTLKKQSAQ